MTMRRLGEILPPAPEGSADAASRGDVVAFPGRGERTAQPARRDGAEAPSGAASRANATVCKICGGARYVRVHVTPDDPRFGQAVPCPCARDESERARTDRLQRYSNIGPLTRLTFRELMPLGRSANHRDQQRYRSCVEDARSFAENPDGWLVFSGASGCGKTHIAAAIVNRLLERGEPALFVVVPDLLDHLRSAYQPGAEIPYDDLFERVRRAPVLVLDDLGTQSPTPWAQEKLFQIINHRFNARLPTVVTTNLLPEQIDERLRTRLTDASIARVYVLEAKRTGEVAGLDVLEHPLIREMTFDRFDTRALHLPPEERRRVENAYRQALAFAEAPDGWLLLIGPHGAGKTHLAASIANYRRARGETPTFVVVPDLLDELRRGFSADDPRSSYATFDAMKRAPLLILDDLDTQTQIGWVRDRLFQLLNYRHTARLPTVITTALSLDELGERLASRLVDHSVCSIIVLGAARVPSEEPARAPRRRKPRGS